MPEAFAMLAGYALGTIQVLSIDWVKRRREHKIQIRAIQAQLHRMLRLDKKFSWGPSGPSEDSIPKPPKVTSVFADLVTSVDFHLTDEFVGDNSQMVLLTILDGCEVLEDTHAKAVSRMDALLDEKDLGKRMELKAETLTLAQSYDDKLDLLQYSAKSAVEDLSRRLQEARYRRQVIRHFRRLSQGENPPEISSGDKRLEGQ